MDIRFPRPISGMLKCSQCNFTFFFFFLELNKSIAMIQEQDSEETIGYDDVRGEVIGRCPSISIESGSP